MKCFYTIFTTAGVRSNYYRTYSIKLCIKDNLIPLDPYPTFLGITMDPKLKYNKHLEKISEKIVSRQNLIKKIKRMRLNSIFINSIIFKSCIQSVFDYAFIILNVHTQRIDNDLQKIQNKLLKSIKYFPPGTTSNQIHNFFKVNNVKDRMKQLIKKYLHKRINHEQIFNELNSYNQTKLPTQQRFETPYDLFEKLL